LPVAPPFPFPAVCLVNSCQELEKAISCDYLRHPFPEFSLLVPPLHWTPLFRKFCVKRPDYPAGLGSLGGILPCPRSADIHGRFFPFPPDYCTLIPPSSICFPGYLLSRLEFAITFRPLRYFRTAFLTDPSDTTSPRSFSCARFMLLHGPLPISLRPTETLLAKIQFSLRLDWPLLSYLIFCTCRAHAACRAAPVCFSLQC